MSYTGFFLVISLINQLLATQNLLIGNVGIGLSGWDEPHEVVTEIVFVLAKCYRAVFLGWRQIPLKRFEF
jgi:hypothetical protein